MIFMKLGSENKIPVVMSYFFLSLSFSFCSAVLIACIILLLKSSFSPARCRNDAARTLASPYFPSAIS